MLRAYVIYVMFGCDFDRMLCSDKDVSRVLEEESMNI